MLYLLIGPYEVRLAARNKTLKGRVPNELEHPSRELLLERAGASSLFGEEGVYLARNILAEDESLLEVFPELVESASLFIFEEESATADVKKRAKEAGANVQEGKAEAKERLNTFALADALGTRDKKKAWALLIEFLRQGAKPEELAGVLHWQARSMLLALGAKTADEVKMKEFVFNKSKRYAKNFKKEELEQLSRDLVVLYHEAHRGGGPMELLLERFVLAL